MKFWNTLKIENMNNNYSTTIQELLQRPIIRNEFNEELTKFDEESYQICLEDRTPEKYPDINAACLSKHIDRDILYNILKESKK